MSEMISLFTYYGNSEEIKEVTFESDWVTYTMKKQQGIPKKRTDQVEQWDSIKINACRFDEPALSQQGGSAAS